MSAQIKTVDVICDEPNCQSFLGPNRQYGDCGSVIELKDRGWQFVNTTPYVEEARTYCPAHTTKAES